MLPSINSFNTRTIPPITAEETEVKRGYDQHSSNSEEPSSKRQRIIKPLEESEDENLVDFFKATFLAGDETEPASNPMENLSRTVILTLLWENGIHTEENCQIVVDHKDRDTLSSILRDLTAARLLTQDNFKEVAKHAKLENLTQCVSILLKHEILHEENLRSVISETPKKPWLLDRLLEQMGEHDVISVTDSKIFNHRDQDLLMHLLVRLKETGFLTKETFYAAASNSNPWKRFMLMARMHDEEILTEKTLLIILTIDKDKFGYLEQLIRYLEYFDLLTEENLLLGINHTNISSLVEAISVYILTSKLTEDDFKRMVAARDPYLIKCVYDELEPELVEESKALLTFEPHKKSKEFVNGLLKLMSKQMYSLTNIKALYVSRHPEKVAEALIRLKKAKILTKQRSKFVSKHPRPDDLAKAFVQNSKAEPFSATNTTLIGKCTSPLELLKAFAELDKSDLLNLEYKKLVAGHSDPENCVKALVKLKEAGLLTKDNAVMTASQTYPYYRAESIILLTNVDLFTDENKKLVLEFESGYVLLSALKRLAKLNLLDQAVLNLLAGHPNQRGLAVAIKKIDPHLLTQESIRTLANHNDPEGLVNAFGLLHRAELWNEERRTMLINHPHPFAFARALEILKESQFVLQNEKLLRDLFTHQQPHLLAMIFLRLLKQTNFEADDNFELAATHQDSTGLLQGMKLLSSDNLFTETNFRALVSSPSPYNHAGAIRIFHFLENSDLLTEENRQLILANSETMSLYTIMEIILDLEEYKERNLSESEIDSEICNFFRVLLEHDNLEKLAMALKELPSNMRISTNIEFLAQRAKPIEVARDLLIANRKIQAGLEYLLRPLL